jgi:hypothetical protein
VARGRKLNVGFPLEYALDQNGIQRLKLVIQYMVKIPADDAGVRCERKADTVGTRLFPCRQCFGQ